MLVLTPPRCCRRGSKLGKECLCGAHYTSSCHIRALRTALYSFSVSYGLRSCLAVLMRAVQLARSRPRELLSLSSLVGEKSLTFREDAVRLGLFTGVFTGGYQYLRCLLQAWRGPSASNTLVAGFVAGLSVLFMHKDTQRTLALYVFARLVQCLYNDAKERKWIKPVLSSLPVARSRCDRRCRFRF